ncbi:hypothetical protein HIM_04997 [Hirsutella minnesotensis 3608]|uniref:Ribosomal RNA-processing protein 17 n=1 Tax=Hirsutella minnesotensis 3608 TaxID=1043627 RepID=A0A0F8A5L4_9HYPO|nr:hypothetical protein HIM_04997 [Hirsutella minnesotensis 3608]
MFAKPRPKKSILPPPIKKRKTTSSVEEIPFDDSARQEYLTGFHKRKQQRIKHAQEQAAKLARQERLDTRKQLREERRKELEEHVETVSRLLRESGAVAEPVRSGDQEEGEAEDEWTGFHDKPDLDIIDLEEEYIDEDRYTTVTVETVAVTREGLNKPQIPEEDAEEEGERPEGKGDQQNDSKPAKPKKRKKKFRYESKVERQLTNSRQRAKSRR